MLKSQIGTMGVVLGRYERDEVKPSIEVAAKISQALGVSLDYLVGDSDVLLDTELIKRITEIQQLSEADRKASSSRSMDCSGMPRPGRRMREGGG